MRRTVIHCFVLCVSAVFVLTASASAQQAPAHYGLSDLPPLTDPANLIILIYNHGSIAERSADTCEMNRLNAGAGVPYVVHEFYGKVIADKTVLVDGYCTPYVGGYDSTSRSGEPKVMKRSKDIEARAIAFAAAGVPAEQIFLVGQSAGGWAALMAKARNPAVANSVIAFSPAFAGQRHSRSSGWQWIHDEYVKELQKAARLDALVFSIQNDAFERPEHHAFMDDIPGVERVILSDTKIGDVACDSQTTSHALFRNVCFYRTQGQRLQAYIEKRLAGAVN